MKKYINKKSQIFFYRFKLHCGTQTINSVRSLVAGEDEEEGGQEEEGEEAEEDEGK